MERIFLLTNARLGTVGRAVATQEDLSMTFLGPAPGEADQALIKATLGLMWQINVPVGSAGLTENGWEVIRAQ